MKTRLIAAAFFFPALLPCLVWAQAVSAPNGKLDLQSGNVNGASSHQVTGSFATPLSEATGLQLDALSGDIGNESLLGFGSHLFWRDPQQGLIGLTMDYAEIDQQEFRAAGVEAEWYLSSSTLLFNGGDLSGDGISDDAFINMEYKYYLTDDWSLSLLGSQFNSSDSVQLHSEYQLPSSNLGFFLEVASGESEYDHFTAGVRYYFGESKSLKQRHREDDPENRLSRQAAAWASTYAVPIDALVFSGPPFVLINNTFGNCMFGLGETYGTTSTFCNPTPPVGGTSMSVPPFSSSP